MEPLAIDICGTPPSRAELTQRRRLALADLRLARTQCRRSVWRFVGICAVATTRFLGLGWMNELPRPTFRVGLTTAPMIIALAMLAISDGEFTDATFGSVLTLILLQLFLRLFGGWWYPWSIGAVSGSVTVLILLVRVGGKADNCARNAKDLLDTLKEITTQETQEWLVEYAKLCKTDSDVAAYQTEVSRQGRHPIVAEYRAARSWVQDAPAREMVRALHKVAAPS